MYTIRAVCSAYSTLINLIPDVKHSLVSEQRTNKIKKVKLLKFEQIIIKKIRVFAFGSIFRVSNQ